MKYDVKEIFESDLFVYNGLSHEKDYAVSMLNNNKNLKIVDATMGMEYESSIEELWLDPSNFLMLCLNIRNGMKEYITNGVLRKQIDENYEKIKLDISELDADIKLLVENAAKAYHSENKDITKVTVLELIQDDLLTTGLVDMDGNLLDGCVRISKDTEGFNVYTYYSECDTVTVELEVTKNGGDSSQVFNTTYEEGEVLELLPLTKTGADFSRWEVVRENSIIRNNKLIFGNTDTEIYALWTNHPTLTVDGNGGTLSNTFNTTYPTGITVELGSATRTGYIFNGWEKTSGDAILSGNRVTMGTQNTVISARWAVNSYTLTLVNSNATTTGSTSVSVEYDGTPSGIINPERTYTVTYAVGSSGASVSKASDTVIYTFDGWYTQETGGTKVINVDGTLVSNVSGYTSSDGKWAKAENTELYAHWTGGGSVTTATITRTGYSCSYGTVGSNESYTPTSSVTLTAQCSANSYTCDAGKYLKAGETTCSSCSAGSYCGGGGLTYSDENPVGINSCPAGKYTNTTGQTSCTTCPDGYYCKGGSNKTACAAGKEGTGTGKSTEATACQACAAGYYAANTGTAACSKCNANTYSTGGASTCTACKSGYTSSEGSNKCSKYDSCKTGSASNTCTTDTCLKTGCTCTYKASGTYSTCSYGCSTCTDSNNCITPKYTCVDSQGDSWTASNKNCIYGVPCSCSSSGCSKYGTKNCNCSSCYYGSSSNTCTTSTCDKSVCNCYYEPSGTYSTCSGGYWYDPE